MRIMVVDDNQDIADTIAMMLRIEDNDVTVSYDGRSALDSIGASMPDLVLCDIGLAGELDGLQVAAACRQQRSCDRIRLVAMSGYSGSADRDRAVAAGFETLLVKPIRYETLMACLRNYTSPRSGSVASRPR